MMAELTFEFREMFTLQSTPFSSITFSEKTITITITIKLKLII